MIRFHLPRPAFRLGLFVGQFDVLMRVAFRIKLDLRAITLISFILVPN
jgi:hypothetical protein